jgi:hypothetical protein
MTGKPQLGGDADDWPARLVEFIKWFRTYRETLREQRRQQRLNVELSALGSLIAKYPDEARGMLARLATSTVPATQMEGTVPDPTLQS